MRIYPLHLLLTMSIFSVVSNRENPANNLLITFLSECQLSMVEQCLGPLFLRFCPWYRFSCNSFIMDSCTLTSDQTMPRGH